MWLGDRSLRRGVLCSRQTNIGSFAGSWTGIGHGSRRKSRVCGSGRALRGPARGRRHNAVARYDCPYGTPVTCGFRRLSTARREPSRLGMRRCGATGPFLAAAVLRSRRRADRRASGRGSRSRPLLHGWCIRRLRCWGGNHGRGSPGSCHVGGGRCRRGWLGGRRLGRRGLRRRSRRRRGSRSRARHGRRGRSRRRSWRWFRSRCRTRREEPERIEVTLVVRGGPHAEMDVWLRHLRITGGADHPDDLTVGDSRSTGDERGAEMCERNRVAFGRHHRDDQAALRHRADEAHRAAGRSVHLLSGGPSNVDASVLSAGVRVGTEAERPQHGSARRPRPHARACRENERAQHESNNHHPPHQPRSLLCSCGDCLLSRQREGRESSGEIGCRQI
jgi:hypothetical protein